jgi:hypothetical protein
MISVVRSIRCRTGGQRTRRGPVRRPRGTSVSSRTRPAPGRCWPGLGFVLCVCRWGDQVRADRLHRFAVGPPPEHGVQHVVGDDRWPAAVVSLAGGGIQPFQGGFADVLAFGLRHRGEEREQHPAGAGGLVDPGQRPGQHLQGDAVRGEVVGQRGQLGGVAAQPLHLVDGEDDPAVRGMSLDLSARLQGGLELRAHVDAGGDLLSEDLVPGDAVRGQRVELGLKFLGEVRARGVADADVRARRVGGDRRRRRGARAATAGPDRGRSGSARAAASPAEAPW